MRLPSRIQIASLKIDIVYDSTLAQTTGCAGQCIYSEQKIIIDPTAHPYESVLQAIAHECVHFILFVQNKHDLRNDEDFVDAFAHLLVQTLTSMEWIEYGN